MAAIDDSFDAGSPTKLRETKLRENTMIDDWYIQLRSLFRQRLKGVRRFGPSARFDTSDVIQDACLQVFNNYSVKHYPDELPSSLLKKIVVGHLVKHYRHHQSAKRSPAREASVPVDQIFESNSPQKTAEINELAGMVFESIDQLDALEQDVVKSHLLLDESYVSIAQRLDCTVPVVRRVFKNAYRKIKIDLQ